MQDLICDDVMIRRTSAMEHPRKDDNEVDVESNTGGAGLPAVDVQGGPKNGYPVLFLG